MTTRMKIKIFTLNGYFNYGNRLQLFALSRVLKNINKKGVRIEVYWRKSLKTRVKELIRYRTPLAEKFKKEIKLKRFTKRFIPSRTSSTKCDYAMIGSDQVWNPDYFKNHRVLLGEGVGGQKISYAASIGTESLVEEQLVLFKNKLRDFKAISVREVTAKDLLRPLTEKPVKVVLDPTLLLDKREYESLEERPQDVKEGEKYILCYILGDREHVKTIEKFAKRHNYRVILFSDKKDSNYGIEEFLYLIHHSELICTDSFHACVFSLIFERPFVAFKRSGGANYMYSRLKNLINTFHLKNREFNGKSITKENLKVDYDEARKVLKREREKSIDFLKESLEIKNERK